MHQAKGSQPNKTERQGTQNETPRPLYYIRTNIKKIKLMAILQNHLEMDAN